MFCMFSRSLTKNERMNEIVSAVRGVADALEEDTGVRCKLPWQHISDYLNNISRSGFALRSSSHQDLAYFNGRLASCIHPECSDRAIRCILTNSIGLLHSNCTVYSITGNLVKIHLVALTGYMGVSYTM